MDHEHHHEPNYFKLAAQTTLHCLTGCGIGDVAGVIIGTVLGLSLTERVSLGVVLGFIFAYILSSMPMLRSGLSFVTATKIILTTEILSILAMEIAMATVELTFPGMKRLGVMHLFYWIALGLSLTAGFVIAFPVNLTLVRKGVRHHH